MLGGIDRQYKGLYNEILRQGHTCDLIKIVISDKTYEHILKGYLDCYDLDLSKYDGVISTKVPAFMVRHPNHVSFLSHRHRQFYDAYTFRHEQHDRFKEIIHKLDKWALSDENIKGRYCIGWTVREREMKWDGYTPEVLYHPTSGMAFADSGKGDYFLAVSRLNDHKRIDYAIKAVLKCPEAKLKIIGTGPEEEKLVKLAAGCDRIEFIGHVNDDQLISTYADCLAVIFTPKEEDLGLITFEAFLSKKPVITCADSGEPAIIVSSAEGGYVVNSIEEITEKMTYLMKHQDEAKKLGLNGYNFMKSITWEKTVKTLVSALSE